MRIGLSYSRCVRDIVDGQVSIDNVLVIIARTKFDPNDDLQWQGIWEGYTTPNPWSEPEWVDYGPEREADFRAVTLELWEQGKLHQPRQFGARPASRTEIWLEAVLPSSELASNPAAKAAWEQFQFVAGLTNVTLDDQYC